MFHIILWVIKTMGSEVSDKKKQDFERFYFAMLRTGPSALGTLGKHSTTKLHSPTLTFTLSCSLGTKHKILALSLLLLIEDRSLISFSEWPRTKPGSLPVLSHGLIMRIRRKPSTETRRSTCKSSLAHMLSVNV